MFIKYYYGLIFLSGIILSIFLPLNPAIYKIGNAPKSLYLKKKKKKKKLYKISLKAVTIGTSSKSHDRIHLKKLPTLLQEFLKHLSYCRRKAFNDGYNKINEFSNFKYNLVSRFNKLLVTATELRSKKTFWRTWNSLLNCNQSLNTQFN